MKGEKLMGSIKLSILIPTLPNRAEMLTELMNSLSPQLSSEVEVLTNSSLNDSIGKKRNDLLFSSNGEYVCFIDDDDQVSSSYITDILLALKSNPDCVSLRGIITWDGVRPEFFEHSIRYPAYDTTENDIKFERFPNHLNTIKASIAKQFKFPEINHGEDTDWATQIHKSGLLKNEVYIDKVLYHYKYVTTKSN